MYLLVALGLAACAGASAGDQDAASGEPDARAANPDAAGSPSDAAPGAADAVAVDAGTPDAGGADAGAPDTGAPDAGGVVAYAHTITIDGSNDFDVANEAFTTTSAGYVAYAAWDAQYLYLAMQGADVGSAQSSRFWLIYLSGAMATTSGVAYNTQQPALPFPAGYHLRWKADNTFTNAVAWTGAAWADAGWSFAGDVFQSGTFVELRVPWVDIGDPATVSVTVAMINETNGGEATFAGAPATSFADGPDPDWGAYVTFDRASDVAPGAYPALP